MDSRGSAPILNSSMDEVQSSVIEDLQVQVMGSQPVMDMETKYMELKGGLPSSEVKDMCPTHQPEIRSKLKKINGMDPEAGCLLQVYPGEEHSSGVPTEEPKDRQAAKMGTSIVSSKECATNQMAKLDEQSDLGHWDQLPVGEVTGSAHLENSDDDSIQESEPKIITSVSAGESHGVKTCLEYQGTYSQTVENLQDSSIPDCKVKDKHVYIPPHRQSVQEWQEHSKKGFKGPPWNVNNKDHLQPGTPLIHSTGLSQDRDEKESEHKASDPGGSVKKSTQSVGTQVDRDCLKPKSKEVSVQCEQMKRPKGLDTSTSTDDFEDYLQSQHAGRQVVGQVKKVGKSRNFHQKVGKSRTFFC